MGTRRGCQGMIPDPRQIGDGDGSGLGPPIPGEPGIEPGIGGPPPIPGKALKLNRGLGSLGNGGGDRPRVPCPDRKTTSSTAQEQEPFHTGNLKPLNQRHGRQIKLAKAIEGTKY